MRGGQVSIEYLLITGFSFLLLAPLLIIFYVQYDVIQEDATNQQALVATRTLAQAAERVYFAGPPSRETVTVRIPAHVTRFLVYEDAVVLTVARGPPKDVVSFTDSIFMPSHPTLNTNEGIRTFLVESTSAGVVISE